MYLTPRSTTFNRTHWPIYLCFYSLFMQLFCHSNSLPHPHSHALGYNYKMTTAKACKNNRLIACKGLQASCDLALQKSVNKNEKHLVLLQTCKFSEETKNELVSDLPPLIPLFQKRKRERNIGLSWSKDTPRKLLPNTEFFL